MSVAIDIADAVVALLNAAPEHTFPRRIEAVRSLLPRWELADLETLRVTVVPSSLEVSPQARGATQYEAAIDIGVQEHIADPDEDGPDHISLAESIAEYLRATPLDDVDASIVDTRMEPLYSVEHLAEHRTMTTVIRAMYRMLR